MAVTYTNCLPCYSGYPNLYGLNKTYTGYVRQYLLSGGTIQIPFDFKVDTCCYPVPGTFKVWRITSPTNYSSAAYADDVTAPAPGDVRTIQLVGSATNIGTITYTKGKISGTVTIAGLSPNDVVWFGWQDNCGNQHVQRVAEAVSEDPCPNPIPVTFAENCFGIYFILNCPLDLCGEDIPTIYDVQAGTAIGYINKDGEFVQSSVPAGEMPTIYGGLTSTPQTIAQGYSLKKEGEVWLGFRNGYTCGKLYELRVGSTVVTNETVCVQSCTYTASGLTLALASTLTSLIVDGVELVQTPVAYANPTALATLISNLAGIPLTSITITSGGTITAITIIESVKSIVSLTVGAGTPQVFTRSACS